MVGSLLHYGEYLGSFLTYRWYLGWVTEEYDLSEIWLKVKQHLPCAIVYHRSFIDDYQVCIFDRICLTHLAELDLFGCITPAELYLFPGGLVWYESEQLSNGHGLLTNHVLLQDALCFSRDCSTYDIALEVFQCCIDRGCLTGTGSTFKQV